jgi:hypothetical protein
MHCLRSVLSEGFANAQQQFLVLFLLLNIELKRNTFESVSVCGREGRAFENCQPAAQAVELSFQLLFTLYETLKSFQDFCRRNLPSLHAQRVRCTRRTSSSSPMLCSNIHCFSYQISAASPATASILRVPRATDAWWVILKGRSTPVRSACVPVDKNYFIILIC